MHQRGIRKSPGCSSIVVDGIKYEFMVGDQSHPESESIYPMLNYMSERLSAAGHVPDTSDLLLNVEEEEKKGSLSQHSEKLAVVWIDKDGTEI